MPAVDVETTVQSFILAALSHEATVDQVDRLLYRHVVEGPLSPVGRIVAPEYQYNAMT